MVPMAPSKISILHIHSAPVLGDLFSAGRAVLLRTGGTTLGAVFSRTIFLFAVESNEGGNALAWREHHGGGELYADLFSLGQPD